MASVSQTAIASSSTDTATPTFAAQAIGANGGSDILYVMAGARTTANATTMSCTIDGVAAAAVAFLSSDSGGGVRSNIGIFALARNSLPDPAQTDVDIVLTHNQVCIRHAVAIAVSPDSSAAASATSSAAPGNTNLNLNTSADAIVIGTAYNGDLSAFGWTGLTEQSDIDVAGEGSNQFTTAYASAVVLATPRTVTLASATDSAAKLAATFSAAGNFVVDAAQAAVAGQTIDVIENPFQVTAAQVAVEGQTIDVTSPIIVVDFVDLAFEGQTINLIGIGESLDLASALYLALTDDLYITSRLGSFMSPSVHTRRPVPEGAEYPMIVVNPDTSITDEDGLVSRRPILVRDVIVYGEQDGQYRVVEELGYYLRSKFHRRRDALTVSGYHVVDILVTGPTPAPTDDFNHVARAVTLTIRLEAE